MTRLIRLLGRVGEWLTELSDQTKKNVCIMACLAMMGSASYKLFVSWQKLGDKPPAASPEQLIKPLQSLFSQTSQKITDQQLARQRDMQQTAQRLDSLNKNNK